LTHAASDRAAYHTPSARGRGFSLPKNSHLDCTVLFSEEEQAIIRERGLGQHFIVADSEMPPPIRSHRRLGILFQALAPFTLLTSCAVGIGMTEMDPGNETVG